MSNRLLPVLDVPNKETRHDLFLGLYDLGFQWIDLHRPYEAWNYHISRFPAFTCVSLQYALRARPIIFLSRPGDAPGILTPVNSVEHFIEYAKSFVNRASKVIPNYEADADMMANMVFRGAVDVQQVEPAPAVRMVGEPEPIQRGVLIAEAPRAEEVREVANAVEPARVAPRRVDQGLVDEDLMRFLEALGRE